MNFLIICGILFSAVAHITYIKNAAPSSQIIDSAKWLMKNSEENSSLLTLYSSTFVFEYFAKRKVQIDPLFYHTGKLDLIKQDIDEIYYSRSMEKTEKLLNEYNINYIIIDEETAKTTWNYPDEGLLFLLTNQEKFPVVYNKGGVKIIYYVK